MKAWPGIAGGVGLIVLGLVVWATAWVAWPASMVLIAVGIVRWVKGKDPSRNDLLTGSASD